MKPHVKYSLLIKIFLLTLSPLCFSQSEVSTTTTLSPQLLWKKDFSEVSDLHVGFARKSGDVLITYRDKNKSYGTILDKTGSEKMSNKTDLSWRIISGDGKVIIAYSGPSYGRFDTVHYLENGEERWKQTLRADVFLSPDSLVVVDASNIMDEANLFIVTDSSGELLWSKQLSCCLEPVFSPDSRYIAVNEPERATLYDMKGNLVVRKENEWFVYVSSNAFYLAGQAGVYSRTGRILFSSAAAVSDYGNIAVLSHDDKIEMKNLPAFSSAGIYDIRVSSSVGFAVPHYQLALSCDGRYCVILGKRTSDRDGGNFFVIDSGSGESWEKKIVFRKPEGIREAVIFFSRDGKKLMLFYDKKLEYYRVY